MGEQPHHGWNAVRTGSGMRLFVNGEFLTDVSTSQAATQGCRGTHPGIKKAPQRSAGPGSEPGSGALLYTR
jgi:hypothetical protein